MHNSNMIKHIVLAGGGYVGFSYLGILAELHKKKFYNINDIKTIYGTSIGSLIGAIMCLKIDWDEILEYVIDRPWEKTISFQIENIFSLFSKNGMYDIQPFKECMSKLLLSKDLPLTITLKELFDYSQIELHIFVTPIATTGERSISCTNMSYKTHPDAMLIETIYKSCTLPFIFQPITESGTYYIDGGIINNYPVKSCIEDGAQEDEILGLHIENIRTDTKDPLNLVNFAYEIFYQLVVFTQQKKWPLKHEIKICCPNDDFSECLLMLSNKSLRKKYITKGKELAEKFLI